MNFDPIPLPAGVSVSPKEGPRLSRRWADRRFADLQFFNELDKGGHFAAMENAEAFAKDVADTFTAIV